MELTRIFNLLQYDRQRRRFRDLALRHSANPADPLTTPDGHGGISVFETACACPTLDGDCICGHIARYYPDVASDPCAYWTFELDALPQRLNVSPDAPRPVVVEVAGDPDECHRNLHHMSDGQADKLRRRINHEVEVRLSVNGRSEAFTEERVIALINEHWPDPQ